MKIYDISMNIEPEMPVWKNRKERSPRFDILSDFDQSGKGNRVTQLTLDMHTGTHIDAPLHFINNGASIDKTPLKELVRSVKLYDLTAVEDHITKTDLLKFDIEENDFLLLKTKNSYCEGFDGNFVYLEQSGAKYLSDRQIAGIGIDALGIERDQDNNPTHLVLLRHGIVIIEGLRLARVKEGRYIMIAAPLKIVGVEAAPARIFLLAPLDMEDLIC